MDERNLDELQAAIEEDYLPGGEMPPQVHTAAPRPMPRPRKQKGKGWLTLLKVTGWLLCIFITAGGTAAGALYAYENNGDLWILDSILLMAGCLVVSAAVGLALLAGVMVACGAARDVAAARRALEGMRRREGGSWPRD